MDGLAELLGSFELRPEADAPEGRFTAVPAGVTGDVVFGGQLLGLCVFAAARATAPDPAGRPKLPQSVSIVFARSAIVGRPLEIAVRRLHDGRALGSSAIDISQAGSNCCAAIAVTSNPEPDLIRHSDERPEVDRPEDLIPWKHGYPWWDIRASGNADIEDPDVVGPPRLDIWTRFPDAPADPLVARALLAYATDGFFIGTAMRPHRGVGQRLAHDTISTTVISHSITFHEEFDAAAWLLLAHRSTYAGNGRSFGVGQVFNSAGRLVASFTQLNLIRNFPAASSRAPGERSKH